MYSRASKPPFDMDPGYSALFRVNVSRPQSLGTFSGEILVHTSFERVLHIPVFYRTAVGGVKVAPDILDFGTVFPYGTSELPLNISNYYRTAVTVTAWQSDPKDLRLYVRPAGNNKYFPRLKPAETIQVPSLNTLINCKLIIIHVHCIYLYICTCKLLLYSYLYTLLHLRIYDVYACDYSLFTHTVLHTHLPPFFF